MTLLGTDRYFLGRVPNPTTSLIPATRDPDAGVTLCRRNELGVEASRGDWKCASPRAVLLITVLGVGPLHQPGSIGSISDDPLLEIFSFYLEEFYEAYDLDKFSAVTTLEAWRSLVHVCRRWRNLVFASPRRLNLRLVCTGRRHVREMLGVWPALPIVIRDWNLGQYPLPPDSEERIDNVIAALEHRDRVCQITLGNLLFPIFTAMMQEPFPRLTRLYLSSEAESPMLLPDSFLGGSAPHLQSLTLASIPFPSLPTLLLTTKDLVELRLWSIPDSGYISPVAMVACLSSLIRLENLELRINFRSLPGRPSQRLPSLTRIGLPTLTRFRFLGTNKYIEELVARINAPLLQDISVAFFHEPPLFDISHLNQFISRIENFKLHRAVLDFYRSAAFPQFSLFEDPVNGVTFEFLAPCTPSGWQLFLWQSSLLHPHLPSDPPLSSASTSRPDSHRIPI